MENGLIIPVNLFKEFFYKENLILVLQPREHYK